MLLYLRAHNDVMTYMLDECTLVLERVTLAQVVEFVIEVLVDLASRAVLDEQAAEDTQTTHPHDLTIHHISIPPHTDANPPYPPSFITLCECSIRQMCESYLGIRASAVPFLFPKPLCRPILLAFVSSRARERECMVTGLRMMRPSSTSLRIV